MKLSYWEHKSWLKDIDFTVIGSGIVGLNTALRLRERFPQAKVVVLERGMLPQGASTKNAGFACFGSVSELRSDLKTHTEDELLALVDLRFQGLRALRKMVGDSLLDYQAHGGYELFGLENTDIYTCCLEDVSRMNALLHPLFKASVYEIKDNTFGFSKIQDKVIFNAFEGQIDTGKMMETLLYLCYKAEIKILNGINVTTFEKQGDTIALTTSEFMFNTRRLCIATNGFSKELDLPQVQPARAQVLITKPIRPLSFKGTFHVDEGYYYFRNIDDRILLGGGRNLDFKTEETTAFGQTTIVQEKLHQLLHEVILPDQEVTVDYAWSGIMGVGSQKRPIVKQISDSVYCGIRLGGMGIAIGTQVGRDMADLVEL